MPTVRNTGVVIFGAAGVLVLALGIGVGITAVPEATNSAIDLATYATRLSAAVASQNQVAFGIPSYSTGVAAGNTASTISDTSLSAASVVAVAHTEVFTSSLQGEAVTVYSGQRESLADTREALVGTEDTVSRITVSVDAVTSTVDSGVTTITTDLHIVRTLTNGISWEEVVPYLSTVDSSTLAVTSLIVQDDDWVISHSTE